jgi:FkbM family methyltransferase
MKTLVNQKNQQEDFLCFASTGTFAKALQCYENKGSLSELNSILPDEIIPNLALHKVLRLLTELRNDNEADAEIYAQNCESLFLEKMKGHSTNLLSDSIQAWSYFYLMEQLKLLNKEKHLKIFNKCLDESFSCNSGEDLKIIKKIFNKKKKGFFVEVGGHDGTSGSYSLLLEKKYDWNGLCIEASPWQFEKMKRTRSCICEQTALGQSFSKEEFYNFPGQLNQINGLKKHFRNNNNFQQHLKRSIHNVIDVNLIPFSELTKKHNINQIDFFVIDVEGAEFEVIKGIDFDNTRIDVFLIEQATKEIKIFLTSKGFKDVMKINNDTLFIHNKSEQFYNLGIPSSSGSKLKYSLKRI